MKRQVLMLAWVLWAHELAAVGEKLVDRGYTAIDSFDTRQQCQRNHATDCGERKPEVARIVIWQIDA